jgi:hypothetical protein
MIIVIISSNERRYLRCELLVRICHWFYDNIELLKSIIYWVIKCAEVHLISAQNKLKIKSLGQI